jgi:hypothetical protein
MRVLVATTVPGSLWRREGQGAEACAPPSLVFGPRRLKPPLYEGTGSLQGAPESVDSVGTDRW